MRPSPRRRVTDEEPEDELERLERLLSALRAVRGLDAARETPDEEAGRSVTASEKGTEAPWWSSTWYTFRVAPPSKPRRLRPLNELRKRAEAEESDIPENEGVRTPRQSSYVVDAGGQTVKRPIGDPLRGVPPPTPHHQTAQAPEPRGLQAAGAAGDQGGARVRPTRHGHSRRANHRASEQGDLETGYTRDAFPHPGAVTAQTERRREGQRADVHRGGAGARE
eukprot:ctg_3165.g415